MSLACSEMRVRGRIKEGGVEGNVAVFGNLADKHELTLDFKCQILLEGHCRKDRF